jgi:hypothetical protein
VVTLRPSQWRLPSHRTMAPHWRPKRGYLRARCACPQRPPLCCKAVMFSLIADGWDRCVVLRAQRPNRGYLGLAPMLTSAAPACCPRRASATPRRPNGGYLAAVPTAVTFATLHQPTNQGAPPPAFEAAPPAPHGHIAAPSPITDTLRASQRRLPQPARRQLRALTKLSRPRYPKAGNLRPKSTHLAPQPRRPPHPNSVTLPPKRGYLRRVRVPYPLTLPLENPHQCSLCADLKGLRQTL